MVVNKSEPTVSREGLQLELLQFADSSTLIDAIKFMQHIQLLAHSHSVVLHVVFPQTALLLSVCIRSSLVACQYVSHSPGQFDSNK